MVYVASKRRPCFYPRQSHAQEDTHKTDKKTDKPDGENCGVPYGRVEIADVSHYQKIAGATVVQKTSYEGKECTNTNLIFLL